MRRKVNRVGQNTLTVSLPSDWVKKQGLKQGDELEVDCKGNSIQIYHGKNKVRSDVSISIPAVEDFRKRLLMGPFLAGYDIFHVKFDESEVFFKIQKCVEAYLFGFEIVNSGRKSCTIQNMAEGKSSELQSTFRHYFFKVKDVIGRLCESLEKKERSELAHVLIIDQSVDKLCLLIRRILNVQGFKDESVSNRVYYITNLLETISDRCRDIARHILKSKKFPSAVFSQVLTQEKDLLGACCTQYYKPDPLWLVDFKKRTLKVGEEIDKGTSIFFSSLKEILHMLQNISEEL